MDDFEDFLSSEMATPPNTSSLQPVRPKSADKGASFLDEDVDFDSFLDGSSVGDVKLPTAKSSLPSVSAGIVISFDNMPHKL
jgi:hypothetical protein